MARYERTFAGEHRTRLVGFKVTPAERAMLEAAASAEGTTLSQYIRELCLHRSRAHTPVVNGTRRNADARALMRELTAIGNNLNQLTRVANTRHAEPQLQELRSTTGLLKAAIGKVLDL